MMPEERKMLMDRVKELESKLVHLRASRRVLLFLLEKTKNERREQILRLEKENQLLQLKNARLARRVYSQQREFMMVKTNEES